MIPPYGDWIDPRAFQLPLKAFREYLLAHGWTPSPTRDNEFLAPNARHGIPYMATPFQDPVIESPTFVLDFFRRLSVLEERHPMEILQEMLQKMEAAPHASNGKNGTNGRKRAKPRASRRKTVAKK